MGDASWRAGDAARYHLFTAEHELRKASDAGATPQVAAIAQLHALQLGASLDAGASGAADRGAGGTHHDRRPTHDHDHFLACAPLRAEALRLELAAQARHEAATGHALVALVAAAADQADAVAAAAANDEGGGAAGGVAAAATSRRARIAQALAAAAAGLAAGTCPADSDDDDGGGDEEDEDDVASGARAWELSARLEATAAAWEAAQQERRRQRELERRRRRLRQQEQQQQQQQKQQQQKQQQHYQQARPGLPPSARGHYHQQQQQQQQQELLAARWGGGDAAAAAAAAAAPPAKRPRQDDPIQLGGTSSDDADAADGDDDDCMPGARGGGGGQGWRRGGAGATAGGAGGGGGGWPPATTAAAAAGWRAGGSGGRPPPPTLAPPFATAAAAGMQPSAAGFGGGGGFGNGGGGGQHQQHNNGNNGGHGNNGNNGGGFQTARLQLVSDLRRKGQHQQAAALQHQQQHAPRAGLTRPGRHGGGNGGNGGNGNGAQGFVPPFVSKAIDSVCNNGNGNGNGGGGGGGNRQGQQQGGGGGGGGHAGGGATAEADGPLSARTLELLRAPSAADLPPELARHEPRLLELVCSEVVDPPGSAGVSWDDIAGLATVKALVKEIVVWPMLNPSIFCGARAPPRGLLLFGPPGTGKTLIGRAIASDANAAFFSISASSLTSKWIGEGEKLVRALFAVAAHLQPSVIFVDEVDSLLSARKAEGEHEASRRLKTELLVQMEGCDPAAAKARVLVVGATNRPEELDEAARRRLSKQIYIPLPCAAARRQMLARQLGAGAQVSAALSDADVDKIVERTAGYSGSDMRALIQEACQGPVRDAVAAHGERVAELEPADLRAVLRRDFAAAARAQRASVAEEEVARYEAYDGKHGARYVAGALGGGAKGGGGVAGADGKDDEALGDDWD